MKTLLLATATAALIFAAPSAFADPPDNHNNGHHGDHDKNNGNGNKPSKPSSDNNTQDRSFSHSENARAVNDERHGIKPTTANPSTVYQNALHNDHNNNNHNGNDHNWNNNNNGHGNDHNWNNNNNGHGNNHNWNNNNHGGTNVHIRINFNRRNVTAEHHYRYRGGAYRWPGGYHYQRWSFGATLPSIFWGQDYWINDYSDYGLAYPPDGAVWVRYGNDALLVDRDSGEILEVVYGQFE